MSGRIEGARQCHYCTDAGNRCTGETLDPLAEVKLCTRHTAALLEYAIRIKARMINKGATS